MEVGKYVKCLRGFAYAITDNKGYYKIDEMHEDGSGVLEVVWHENTDYIGRKEGVLHLDDFEEVDESVVFEKFDEEISVLYVCTPSSNNFCTLINSFLYIFQVFLFDFRVIRMWKIIINIGSSQRIYIKH